MRLGVNKRNLLQRSNEYQIGKWKLCLLLIPLQVYKLYARQAGKTLRVNSHLVQLGVRPGRGPPNEVSFLGTWRSGTSHSPRKVGINFPCRVAYPRPLLFHSPPIQDAELKLALKFMNLATESEKGNEIYI